MSDKITLVVGASRGIGHELVHQLSQNPQNKVYATVRQPIPFPSSNVKSITLDQRSNTSIAAAASQIPELDTLIINAAIGKDEKLLDTTDTRLAEYFDVNAIGALRIVQAFLPALKARKTRKILLISSQSGSMARQINATGGFRGPYAVSKAALNMIAVQLHNELHEEGFTVVPLHPGWVATDMGNEAGSGAMPIPKSVEGILHVLEKVTLEDSAKFYLWDGAILPW
ncbi:hypothetical protein BGW36DRAFT_313715 [Talaromyces proteolyticus]|uniref:NAD(P)-binding protein n=1 Tax=Talaromyces proteolyticus TaxID=1131652 RepID=A0AAD4Q5F8_9EURO|nr:uncharacterized protein BGW36DRAFT_313715 [Talaromyces proteolyticus]KAH8704151.1 hypothetical protein BGW36DRAFT_313715 [Talaromyces proteolyticus]